MGNQDTMNVLAFVPMLILGYQGLPRRYAEYPEQFVLLQQVSSVGVYLIGIGVVLCVINMIQSLRVGALVTDADVWNLKEIGQFTGEWQWFERKLEAQRKEDERD